MTSSALLIRPDQADWTDEQRAAVRRVVDPRATDEDLAVLFHVAARTGLDVFTDQLSLLGKWDPRLERRTFRPFTRIDGFRLVCERHPQYAGTDDPDAEWCGPDGVWRDAWVADEPPVAARYTVLRHDRDKPIRGVARFVEYVDVNEQGVPRGMWASKGGKPSHMIAKVAEALARRKAFPQDLSGLYTDDELPGMLRGNEPVELRDPAAARPTLELPAPPAGRQPSGAPDWLPLAAEHERNGDVRELERLGKLARAARAPEDVRDAIAAALDRVRDNGPAVEAPAPSGKPAGRPCTHPQRQRLVLLLAEGGVEDRLARIDVLAAMAGRDLVDAGKPSSKDLTDGEAKHIATRLADAKKAGELEDLIRRELARRFPLDELPNPSRPQEWHADRHPVRRHADSGLVIERADMSTDCTVCNPPEAPRA